MTRIEVEARVNPVMRLRTLAATARAVAMGITNAALGRVAKGDVDLRAGDLAPELALRPPTAGRTSSAISAAGRRW